jgi:hypothetical protein
MELARGMSFAAATGWGAGGGWLGWGRRGRAGRVGQPWPGWAWWAGLGGDMLWWTVVVFELVSVQSKERALGCK